MYGSVRIDTISCEIKKISDSGEPEILSFNPDITWFCSHASMFESSSLIQTILSVLESHQFSCLNAVRGLYRR